MAAFKKVSPFSQPLPDDRISLCVYADNTGLRMWNKNSDPMPIKTRNMAGLQKWEETEDYIIYLDKDAVMTTVNQYVTGTYDLFKERKADIDRAMDLLKINNIEWTSEDDSKLILDINKAQLERIANTPTTMEEEDFTPQTFTTRAVPTTYECCFRVDKSSGEIYIGKGYNNIYARLENLEFITSGITNRREGKRYIFNENNVSNDAWINFSRFNANCKIGDNLNLKNEFTFRMSDELLSRVISYDSTGGLRGQFEKEEKIKDEIKKNNDGTITWTIEVKLINALKNISGVTRYPNIYINKQNNPPHDFNEEHWIEVISGYTLQDSTVFKPFVKSIMPSGKLAFVTEANTESHSFIMKEVNFNGVDPRICLFNKGDSYFKSDFTGSLEKETAYFSKIFTKYGTIFGDSWLKGASNNFAVFAGSSQNKTNSFKQLLIYKGNLTEAELKAENEKNIRLK